MKKNGLLSLLIFCMMLFVSFKVTALPAFAMIINVQVQGETDTFTLDVEPSDLIGFVKQMIQTQKGYPKENQTLSFGAKILEDDKALADYNIQKESTITLEVKANGYSYLEASWDAETKTVDTTAKTADATLFTSDMTSVSQGWYIVNEDVTVSSRITISGTVNLILADGKTLRASSGITTTGAVLNIYSQTEGTGALVASVSDANAAGIGGVSSSGGSVTIYGGTVNATGGPYGAGIGGGNGNDGNGGHDGNGGEVTILRGEVTAQGGTAGGAGIGGGNGGNGEKVTIYGGKVTATGGSNSAGIGGGDAEYYRTGGKAGEVTIYGGEVTASGSGYSAGIGTGNYGNGGSVTIYGGTVTANGAVNGAGIGGGYCGSVDNVTIYDGTVNASGGPNAAGIGGGYSGGVGILTIHGGTVTAKGNACGAGIGGGDSNKSDGKIIIDGGKIAAYQGNGPSAAIGSGSGGQCVEITINDGEVNAYANSTIGAAIGGYSSPEVKITINGGVVNADGRYSSCSGIGGCANGEVTINGGTVTALGSDYGAGIGGYAGNNSCKVTINGGTVMATGGELSAGIGGGSGCSCKGVTITGGTVTASSSKKGAGIGGGAGGSGCSVMITGGTVTATGGDDTDKGNSGAGIGGGVSGNGGSVTISGGTVKAKGGRNAKGIGSGASANVNGTITLDGCILYGSDNSFDDVAEIQQTDGDYARYLYMTTKKVVASVTDDETVTNYTVFNDAVTAWRAAGAGAKLKLLKDVSISSYIEINTGTNEDPMVLDLNGYGIISESDMAFSITMNYHLTLTNSRETPADRYITLTNGKGTAVSDEKPAAGTEGTDYITVKGGFITGGFIQNNGSFTMNGGTICGIKSNAGVNNNGTFVMNGGTICNINNRGVNNYGSFTMNEGCISGCKGGVSNIRTFTMKDGEISGNNATGHGGGIINYGTLVIEDGEISGNTATGNGGGIFTDEETEVTISGGSICDNSAALVGGGFASLISQNIVNLSGSPVISGNVSGSGDAIIDDDVNLAATYNNIQFTINAGSFTEEAEIGIKMATPGVFTTNATFADNAAAAAVFFSDDSKYEVTATDDKQAQLTEVPSQYVLVKGVTGSFDEKIKLNFYFEVPETVELSPDAYVTLSGGEDNRTVTTKFSESVQTDKGYRFSIPLVAKEASDTITANVYDESGNSISVKGSSGTFYGENELQYSLMQYFNKLEESAESAAQKKLGAAAKDYCTAAQIYFGYKADGLSVSSAVNAVTANDLEAYVSTRVGTKPADVKINGISAMLESDNTIRIYLTTTGNYTYKIDGETATLVKKSDGSTYLALTKGTASNELQKEHAYTIVSSSGDTYTINASVLTYARSCVRKGDTKIQNLGKTLYLYNKAAIEAFGTSVQIS